MVAPPVTVATKFRKALALHQQGRLDSAERLLYEILQAQPQNFDALHLLGIIEGQSGRTQTAVDLFSKAVAMGADSASVYSNLGNALRDVGRYQDAVASCERALAIQPDHVGALCNRGNALVLLGRTDEALSSYYRALAIKSDCPETLYNCGVALQAEALTNRGVGLRKGRSLLDEAIANYRQALALKPDFAAAHSNLGDALKDTGQIDEAIASYQQAMTCRPKFHEAHSGLLFTIQYSPCHDSAEILQEARRWNDVHALPLKGKTRPHTNVRDAHRRLRVGYVSPDFRRHCQSLFTTPLLAQHDHGQFEIYCYADVPRPDDFTQRIQQYADCWRSTVGLADAEIAKLIHDDSIDILVDLTMHMGRGRPLVFAMKPAPIQVAWLAYPGTTGIHTIDYRLTDPYLDPPGQQDQCYTEQSIRLPDTFWCYDPLTTEPRVSPLPAEISGHVTFGFAQ